MSQKRAIPLDHATTMALLWSGVREGRRGPRPALSLELIVARAIALADRDGLAALSMERVAREVGFTTMALYRYVPGKEELLAVMIDHGLGDPPPLSRVTPWRAALLLWAGAMHAIFLRHPWSLEATGRLRLMGPRELSWLEAGLSILASTGLNPPTCHAACLAIIGEVRTNAQFSASQRHGLTGRQWASATRDVIEDKVDRFPQLHALLSYREKPTRLEESLGWVLDGIETRVGRQEGTKAR